MSDKILPQGSVAAVKTITEIAEKLLALMEQEARALTVQDSMTFLATQDEKNALIERYEAATQEFKERLESLRAVDVTMRDRLEDIQDALAKQALENNEIIKRLESDKEIRQMQV